jgi:hypothetical protein
MFGKTFRRAPATYCCDLNQAKFTHRFTRCVAGGFYFLMTSHDFSKSARSSKSQLSAERKSGRLRSNSSTGAVHSEIIDIDIRSVAASVSSYVADKQVECSTLASFVHGEITFDPRPFQSIRGFLLRWFSIGLCGRPRPEDTSPVRKARSRSAYRGYFCRGKIAHCFAGWLVGDFNRLLSKHYFLR